MGVVTLRDPLRISPGEYDWTCASLGPPKPKRQLNWSVQRLLHSPRQKVPISTMGFPFIQNCPFPWGSGPHLIHGSLCPPETSVQTASRLVQPFLYGSIVWRTDRPTYRPRYSVG